MSSGLSSADRGCLVLADISGYTDLLLTTELEHAEDALNDLIMRVVESLGPVLTLSKLEGDAAFAYVLAGAYSASTVLDAVDRAYDAFRTRLRDIDHATTCTCRACVQIPGLDLKFVVHDGQFVRRGNDLIGPDVILLHRLLKTSAADAIGSRGYALLTQACVDALGLNPDELRLVRHVERYDDVGDVVCWLDDLAKRWEEEQERVRVYVPREGASFDHTYTAPLPREVVWDWITSPARRAEWQADAIVQVAGGGRLGLGATNHCMHGDDVTVEEIVDWKPFDYYSVRYDFPLVGSMLWTIEVAAEPDGRTRFGFRGQGFESERREAWEQLAPNLMPVVDGMHERLMHKLDAEPAPEPTAR